jgi:hypothetical protein
LPGAPLGVLDAFLVRDMVATFNDVKADNQRSEV